MAIDRQSLITELEHALAEEVACMRVMLTSLHDEHEAILGHDAKKVEQVMEMRLPIIEAFEGVTIRVIALIADLMGIDKEGLGHELAVEELRLFLADDELELHSLIQQRREVLNEIFSRNDANAHLLKDHPLSLHVREGPGFHYINPLSVTYGTTQKRTSKTTLLLLDPGKEEEDSLL